MTNKNSKVKLENQIFIAGSGGQGILFMGTLLAYSGMIEEKEVTWFPSYGAEVRGGTANCTVILSDKMIASPIVRHPEILVLMNSASLNKFQPRLKNKGLLIYDSSLIKEPDLRSDINIIAVPASEISASIGNIKYANMVILGSLIAQTGFVKENSVISALEKLTSSKNKKFLDANKEALTKGRKYIENKKSPHN